MYNYDETKVHFEPSTIETIDKSVLSFLESLNLFADTNTGWRKVPVIWASAERSYQVKKRKDVRDSQGMLVLPLITVNRTQLVKDMASKGVFQGNVFEDTDEQGGSLETSRIIYQEKTLKFANADSYRLYGQLNFPRCNPKVVYKTISAPMPVNVSVEYEITIRTEYQQQMNELLQPFITKPGTINYLTLKEATHRYEGFIQPNFSTNNNLSDFTSEERKFETKINLKVVGYLVGEGDNREKPHFAVRENAVEVKIPRERISLREIPTHEYGAYYGLAGVPSTTERGKCPSALLLENIPAINPMQVGTGVITVNNFAQVLSDSFVFRETLKLDEDPIAGSGLSFNTTKSIKANTELLFLNGMILAVGANNDYTIDGNVITLTEPVEENDSLYITYIVAS